MSWKDALSNNMIKSVKINIGKTQFIDNGNNIIEVKTIGKCYNCHNNINHSMSISCDGKCYMCWKCLEFQHIIKETELNKGHNPMCKNIVPKCYNNGCKGERLVQPCFFYEICKNYTRDCSECLNKAFFGINGYCDGCFTTIPN